MADLLELPFKPVSGKPPSAVLHRLLDAVSRAGDKPLVLTLKAQKKRRSLNQNAYLWAVVYPAIVEVFREHGNNVDAEDVHAYCKDHIGKLKQVFVTPHGEVLTGPGSTAKLGTMEFVEDYEARRDAMEKVVRGLHADNVEAVVVPLKAPL